VIGAWRAFNDAGAAVLVVSMIAVRPAPRYIWNASESVPIGLYRLHPTGRLAVTQLVAVEPPEPLATFLAGRRYLPRGISTAESACWRFLGRRFAETKLASRSTRSNRYSARA